MKKAYFLTNYINLGILAISGFLANILCDFFFSANEVGILNTATSIYIVLTQCATWGQQIHLQSQLPLCQNHAELKKTLSDSLATSIFVSTLVAVAAISLTIATGSYNYIFLAITTFFMGPAKTLTFAQLGLGKYNHFAASNSVRPITFLALIIFIGWTDLPEYLGLSFLGAEFATLIFTIVLSRSLIDPSIIRRAEISKNLLYNSSNFISMLVMEINTRIDLIFVSFLGSKQQVAIYSVALIFFEGFYQALVVIRNITAKTLTTLSNGDAYKLKEFVSDVTKKTYLFSTLLGVIALIAIPLALSFYKNKSEYSSAVFLSYTVILIQVISSGYLVYDNFLGVTNRPRLYLFQKSILLGINLVMHPVLFLKYSLSGTAVATSLFYATSALLNYFAIKKVESKSI